MHGCRQLVLKNVRLSPKTSETLETSKEKSMEGSPELIVRGVETVDSLGSRNGLVWNTSKKAGEREEEGDDRQVVMA